MSMIVDGTNGLTFNNNTVQASAGTVLQVVQGTLSSGYVGTSSTTYVSSGITATITPKFATSKILMQFSSCMYFSTGGGPAYVTFYKNNTTNLSTTGVGAIGVEFFNVGSAWIPCSAVYLDSPATTSATTYSVYFRVNAGASSVLIGGDSGLINSIVLMEIAG